MEQCKDSNNCCWISYHGIASKIRESSDKEKYNDDERKSPVPDEKMFNQIAMILLMDFNKYYVTNT